MELLGVGIAIAGISISTASVIITVIKTKSQKKEVSDTCPMHSGVIATFEHIKSEINNLKNDFRNELDDMREDIKTIINILMKDKT